MNPNFDPIRRLFQLAKEAPPAPPSGELPYAFATRVLARLNESLPESPWERLALGALPVAAAVALLCFLVPALTAHEARMPDDYQVAQAFIQTSVEP
jgi:hypothetical protein